MLIDMFFLIPLPLAVNENENYNHLDEIKAFILIQFEKHYAT